ncbi:PucR family transcriptional regulator [Levilinea saccharolytica]|uniref:PucR family transcriptional regulator n=1 Tax=Levilinea saccharolytica TaxID=229921 RepID=A0A0P6Y623_9CHLR|nr:PucR family transcriptional regulator [Levilinea saccharolytica]KPL84956.1 hypothetical protein ADN01_06075 [Levilinea saccharolytica]GAP18040.1 purine catabolism regulatory protein-like family [Levilinea saccharolytica]
MPLTLQTALDTLPIFSTASVIAGQGGLGREIRWTHIVDNPDILPWVREGDLLLTTAFAIKDHPESSQELVANLQSKGLAGMVVAVGRYVLQIPAAMVAAANQLDFPILTLPWDVPFVEVTHAIHEFLLKEQHALTERSLTIHTVLTQLVVDGGGLDDLAAKLAALLQRSVTIEDDALNLLASAYCEVTDELRDRSVAEKRTPSEGIQYFRSIRLFQDLQNDPRPKYVAPAPRIGMTLERLVSPILVGSQLYGYIWIIAEADSLSPIDFLAIERGAAVAALVMSREHAVYEAEQRGKMQILGSLIDPSLSKNVYDLTDTLGKLGLKGDYQVAAFEEISSPPKRLDLLVPVIEQTLRMENIQGTVVEWGRKIVVLMGDLHNGIGREVVEKIVASGSLHGAELLAGLSGTVRQPAAVRACYQEASEALHIGRVLCASGRRIWEFDRLGYLQWQTVIPEDLRKASFFEKVVEQIAKYDEERGTDFLLTLEVYTDELANAQIAAKKLFVHRNTLRQRLLKIEDLWEVDLSDSNALINLHVAIKGLRLRKAH